MWDLDKNQGKGSASKQGFVKEGNIDVYLFNEKPTRVRFLTEQIDVDDIMQEQKISREEAQEFVHTELIFEKWVMPIAKWEHSIPGIPGKRFFSTQVCLGRRTCPLCEENNAAKEKGISENKMLPFPVRKRFFVPAYFYDMGRIMFVKNSEEFFQDIAQYINRNEGPVDFEIYRTGKGFNTKYKSTFVGSSMDADIPDIGIKPKDMDFNISEEELKKKISEDSGMDKNNSSSRQQSTQSKDDAGQTDSSDGGSFVLPFGNHKGNTIAEVYQLDPSYLEFFAENSSGLLQTKVTNFMSKV